MARSSKSKLGRRLRASKRMLLKNENTETIRKLNRSLKLSSKGFEFRKQEIKNAFLHQDDKEAQVP